MNKTFKQRAAFKIWMFCERHRINLRWFAPAVFSAMIGAKGRRVK